MSEINLTLVDGHAVTTSNEIAKVFKKLHKDVIRKIEALECSEEFNRRNFAPVDYIDGKGEKRKEYQITRDGFTLLVMGFTGKRAMQYKEAYIEAFNTMERQLRGEGGNNPLALPPPQPEALTTVTVIKPGEKPYSSTYEGEVFIIPVKGFYQYMNEATVAFAKHLESLHAMKMEVKP